jgi:hypothetical protein
LPEQAVGTARQREQVIAHFERGKALFRFGLEIRRLGVEQGDQRPVSRRAAGSSGSERIEQLPDQIASA